MEKLIVKGNRKLKGNIKVSGSKNVALKTFIAASLTDDDIIIKNVPLISDVFSMLKIFQALGGKVNLSKEGVLTMNGRGISKKRIPLEMGALIRTSSMFIVPLLLRKREAFIPNPGGCRIGARPIGRIIDGLQSMGAHITYSSEDGYFHARGGLHPARIRFPKNTHTGTETLMLAAVLLPGETVIENAAEEPEVDDLIQLLVRMGAQIKRRDRKTILIKGVSKLHGAGFAIMPDRNEVVTFAIAAMLTGADVLIGNGDPNVLTAFLKALHAAGCTFTIERKGIRFLGNSTLKKTSLMTRPYPGFMTDWQGPWAVLMTKAKGISTIHETIYEDRFGYALELQKMGAAISLFNPRVKDPKSLYNFNLSDDRKEYFHAVRIVGPNSLHNAVLTISDLRAGATLVLASLAAKGESIIHGVEHLDRGYERFDERLSDLGADIKRIKQ